MVESQPETLPQQLARYRRSDNARGVFELIITAGPFFIIWAVMWVVLVHGHWSGLLLVVPASGLVVRLFMIQHDCGHGSFFHGRLANDWVGRAIAPVFGLDHNEPAGRYALKTLLRSMLNDGTLKRVTRKDTRRKDRAFVEVGKRAAE